MPTAEGRVRWVIASSARRAIRWSWMDCVHSRIRTVSHSAQSHLECASSANQNTSTTVSCRSASCCLHIARVWTSQVVATSVTACMCWRLATNASTWVWGCPTARWWTRLITRNAVCASMASLLITVGCAKCYRFFVRSSTPIPILVCSAVRMELWRTDCAWIRIAWYLIPRGVVWPVCRTTCLATLGNASCNSEIPTAKSTSSTYARCVHRDSTSTSNSTACRSLPSATPMIPTQEFAPAATQATNSPPLATAVLSCSIASSTHLISWSIHRAKKSIAATSVCNATRTTMQCP